MTIAVSPLIVPMVDDVVHLMDQGAPYVTTRTASDYWAYATLLSSTCHIGHHSTRVLGGGHCRASATHTRRG